jgi:hypothetical protein
VVIWPAVSGRVYSVSWTADLAVEFQPLPESTTLPWTQTSYTDTVHSADALGCYRVSVSLAPAP